MLIFLTNLLNFCKFWLLILVIIHFCIFNRFVFIHLYQIFEKIMIFLEKRFTLLFFTFCYLFKSKIMFKLILNTFKS
jgi:hypothetical protein